MQKIDFTATAKSKVGSMDNVKHKPLGGDIKVGFTFRAVLSGPCHEKT